MPADYTVAIDWSGNGDFNGVGENVTARVLDRGSGLTAQYGRDQARALSPLSPGEARLELNNDSRDYSPDYAASPLAGLVRPGRPVKITATLNAVDYGLFRGHLDDFDILPDINARSVSASCLDALAKLKGVNISTGLYDARRSGEIVALILDAVGWPTDARDLDLGATLVPWWWVENQDAYEALMAIVDSEGPAALVSVDIDRTFIFRDRHHRLTRTASTTVQATFRDAGAEPLLSPPMTYDHGWRDIVNTVAFSVPDRALAAAESTVWEMEGQRTITDGETLAVTAVATSPFRSAITPEAGTDFTLLSGVVTVSLSRTSGQSTTIYFTATGGPATIADLQLRAYSLETRGTVVVSAEDTASIAEHGRRSMPSSRDPVWANQYDAQAIADLIIGQRANRLPIVTATLVGGNDIRLLHQLSRDLSDRVRIVETQTGLDDEFYIERIEHAVTDLRHVTRFGCEKVATQVDNALRFDVAGRGFNDGAFGAIGLDDPDLIMRFDVAGRGFNDGLFAY